MFWHLLLPFIKLTVKQRCYIVRKALTAFSITTGKLLRLTPRPFLSVLVDMFLSWESILKKITIAPDEPLSSSFLYLFFMILTPFILVFMQLEQNQSVHKDTSTDFRAGMRSAGSSFLCVHDESNTHCSHFTLFQCWRGNVMARGGERRGGRARPGAIHHAHLTGIFKDNKPSAAAIHQL